MPRNLPMGIAHRRDDFARSRALVEAIPDGAFYFRVGPYGAIRHLPSGMLCEIYEDRRAMSLERLVLYPGGPPGDDIACVYATAGDGRIVLRARRAGQTSAAELAAAMVAAIEREHPDAKALPETFAAKGSDTGPLAAHSYAISGNREIASVWIAREGDWILTAEATYFADLRSTAEIQAGMAFLFAQVSAHFGCGPGARWLEGSECPG
jgi:hypothetical protein